MSVSFHPLSHRVRLSAKCKSFKQKHFPLTNASQTRVHWKLDYETLPLAANLTAGTNLFNIIRGFTKLRACFHSILLPNSCVSCACTFNMHAVNTQAVKVLCSCKHNDCDVSEFFLARYIERSTVYNSVCFRQTLFLIWTKVQFTEQFLTNINRDATHAFDSFCVKAPPPPKEAF